MARHWLPLGAIAITLMLPGCGSKKAGDLSVDSAWVRLPAVPGRPGAGYFTLHGSDEPARLLAIESPQAQSIELHESMKGHDMPGMAGGAMTMQKLDGVDVPANGTVAFAPNGYHAMIFGIDPAVTPGKQIKLTFRFAKGQPVTVDAKAVAAGDPAP